MEQKKILLLYNNKDQDFLDYIVNLYTKENSKIILFCENILLSFSEIENKDNLTLYRVKQSLFNIKDKLSKNNIDKVIIFSKLNKEILEIIKFLKRKQKKIEISNDYNLKKDLNKIFKIIPNSKDGIEIFKNFKFQKIKRENISYFLKNNDTFNIFDIKRKNEEISTEKEAIYEILKEIDKKEKIEIKQNVSLFDWENYNIIVDSCRDFEILDKSITIEDEDVFLNIERMNNKTKINSEEFKKIVSTIIKGFNIKNNIFTLLIKKVNNNSYLFKIKEIGLSIENLISRDVEFKNILTLFYKVNNKEKLKNLRYLFLKNKPNKFILFKTKEPEYKIFNYINKFDFINIMNRIFEELSDKKIKYKIFLIYKSYILTKIYHKSNLSEKVCFINELDLIINSSSRVNKDTNKKETFEIKKRDECFTFYNILLKNNLINSLKNEINGANSIAIKSNYLSDNLHAEYYNCLKICNNITDEQIQKVITVKKIETINSEITNLTNFENINTLIKTNFELIENRNLLFVNLHNGILLNEKELNKYIKEKENLFSKNKDKFNEIFYKLENITNISISKINTKDNTLNYILENIKNEELVKKNQQDNIVLLTFEKDKILFFSRETKEITYLEYLFNKIDLNNLKYIYLDITNSSAYSYLAPILNLYNLGYILYINESNSKLIELFNEYKIKYGSNKPEVENYINITANEFEEKKNYKEEFSIKNNKQEVEILVESLKLWNKFWLKQNFKGRFLIENIRSFQD